MFREVVHDNINFLHHGGSSISLIRHHLYKYRKSDVTQRHYDSLLESRQLLFRFLLSNRKQICEFFKGEDMHDLKLTPEMVPVIKLARSLDIPYSWISGYYKGLNFGRIADVVKGRLYSEIPSATRLPKDFPVT